MNFTASVRIARPIEDVFAFVADPPLFPRWNSAVESVRLLSGHGAAGSTYAMQRNLPSGRAENGLEVLVREAADRFDIRTTSGPTPFVYRYRFTREGEGTLVDLDATVELGGAAAMLGPVAARAVKRGVDANFATLRQLLES
jgi:carbon monoxide dehydrogenase subunit G